MSEAPKSKRNPPFHVPVNNRVVVEFYPGQVRIQVERKLKNGQYIESWSAWLGYRIVAAFLARWHSGYINPCERDDVVRSADIVSVPLDGDILPALRRIGHAENPDGRTDSDDN